MTIDGRQGQERRCKARLKPRFGFITNQTVALLQYSHINSVSMQSFLYSLASKTFPPVLVKSFCMPFTVWIWNGTFISIIQVTCKGKTILRDCNVIPVQKS
jgi:hypothetical protein